MGALLMAHPTGVRYRLATLLLLHPCVQWPETSQGPATASRLRKLRELGVESTLRGLLDDRNMNVKERAKTALAQFTGGPASTVF